ncbi:ABC transporter substrate-binding protein [Rhodobacter sp. 24-YEA-8]|uniref:ABC transporter substrate-binding protein n=1 Tax=Rhodobacter sp. 24-YEA-8 TaxID=1884310 RepID=UPI0008992F04|nr:ABC transporter substrate-binding protein [Rhodobacter sp. 24-YEA-8]SED26396.1 NitT/TauT family transport system substrate-binding protein [Rhodobacter sp. 24-YEA-8]
MTSPLAFSRRSFLATGAALGASLAVPMRAAAQEALTLAWYPGIATPQVPLALTGDLWSPEGVAVNPVGFSSGREALEAVLGGAADFATLSEFPATLAALRDQPFRVLANLSLFTDNKIIANRKSGVTDLASLQGRKFGVTVGVSSQFLADSFFADHGITTEPVNIPPSELVPALARGDVDAVIVFDSFYKAARDALGEDYLEFPITDYPTFFIVGASEKVIEERPDAVRGFLRGLLSAQKLVSDQAKTVQAITDSTSGAFTLEAANALWPVFDFRVALPAELLKIQLAEGKWLNAQGLIPTEVTEELLRSHIADQFLRELAPEAVTL